MKRPILYLLAFLTFSVTAHAQQNLFASYDCRWEAEVLEVRVKDHTPPDLSDIHQAIEAHGDHLYFTLIDTTNAWRYWSTRENYELGKDRGSLRMIADLQALHPYFRDKIIQLIQQCQDNGITLAIVETYRTHAKQHEYKTMGRKFTRSGAGRSKHQYGLAVDLVPIVDGQAQWDDKELWKKVGLTGERLGLRWGGRWRHPYDPGHFEWTNGLSTTELRAGADPRVPESLYPCLSEDIRLLEHYWNAWESEQSSMASAR